MSRRFILASAQDRPAAERAAAAMLRRPPGLHRLDVLGAVAFVIDEHGLLQLADGLERALPVS